jgi:hypothetical protein
MRALFVNLVVATASFGLLGNVYGGTIVLFNNFGPGNSYGSGAWALGHSIAESFTPSNNVTLNSLLLGLDKSTSNSDGVIVSLRTDGGSNLFPSITILESFTVPGSSLPLIGTTTSSPITENSVLQPSMTAGTLYWIEVTPASTNTSAGWNQNSIGDSGPLWENGFGTSNQVLGALEVTANTVPEPESLTLFMFGAVTIGFLRRAKTNRQSTIK